MTALNPKPPLPSPSSGSGWRPLDTLSLGGWIILLIAVISTITVLVWPIRNVEGIELWTFARNHGELYKELAVDYNIQAEAEGREPLNVLIVDGAALTRRTQSGFWSNTPVADLIEVERGVISNYVSGPVENIGFTDLTDLLEAEGLLDAINAPSFAPWTSRGRIFGLPHDVHPVLLCYRADLVEQAGIDVSQIETWDDFVRLMSPLIDDLDGDGRPDRYLLNLWFSSGDSIEALMLQAGGGTFDPRDQSLVSSDANAMVAAHVVHWTTGPGRIGIDAPNFSASGNQLKLEGRVVAEMMPDWLAGIWQSDLPQLSGKLKLMPLPAWEKGGRRTSVQGGTMLGIPKATDDFDAAWDIAKYLYLSKELAEELFDASNIISPVKTFWDEPFYALPSAYFSGQASGTAYIEQAPDVPFRSSNPFHTMAMTRILEAISTLQDEAASGRIVPVDQLTAEALIPRAKTLLLEAEARVAKEMSRNVFLREAEAPAESSSESSKESAGGAL